MFFTRHCGAFSEVLSHGIVSWLGSPEVPLRVYVLDCIGHGVVFGYNAAQDSLGEGP